MSDHSASGHPSGMIIGNLTGWFLYGVSHLLAADVQTWAAAASLILSISLLIKTAIDWLQRLRTWMFKPDRR